MKFWELATNISAKKRAAVVFLTLTGKAREAVLEVDPEQFDADDGLTKLYEKLDGLFKEDKSQATLNAYERFEKYKRSAEMNIADFRVEFDRLVQQLRFYAIELPEAVLAYRALKSANLSLENEKLVRATVPDITLKEMMKQIQKVVGVDTPGETSDSLDRIQVKQEPNVNYAAAETNTYDQLVEETEEVYYGSQGYSGRWNQGRGYRRGRNNNRRGFRGARANRGAKKTNPPGPDGKTSTCKICGSFMHWVRDCPHKEQVEKWDTSTDNDSVHETHIVLINMNEDNDSLLGQTLGAAILDSGCSKTVCGKEWYDCFIETLSDGVKNKVTPVQSDSIFRFGNGVELRSLFKVNLPCCLAGKKIEVSTDVIDSSIPLLLSKRSMKKAGSVLDFTKDTVTIFDKQVKLQCTSSGHYFVNLTRQVSGSRTTEVLFVKGISKKNEAEKKKVAEKLHKQFSHPSSEKLLSLVKNSGVKDKAFLKVVREVPSQCEVCIRYKKAKPKPVVGMPLASAFNELVAMDLKEIKGRKVLHMIDHATRYSVASPLKSKEGKEIVSAVMKLWVAYFGAPKSFLTDNGREFNNSEFRDMAQNLNSIVRTTAAYSPWSNGLNERHNAVLGDMVVKTIEDAQCSLEDAVSWAVSAKNSLSNFHGFSANQLIFGSNPNIPSVLVNSPPALECISTSETVAKNLNAMHAARRAFIKSESSEKLQRALKHQIRSGGSERFETGDMVYFKRPNVDRWMGPGSVIGRENKQILVKHGGTYIRVHPCKLQRYQSKGVALEGQTPITEVPAPEDSTAEDSSTDICSQDMNEINLENSEEEEIFDLDDFTHAPVEADAVPVDLSIDAEPRRHSSVRLMPTSSARNKVDNKWNLPQPGDNIDCRLNENDGQESWTSMRVISRGGKATGANKFVMNVSVDGGHPTWLDFKKSVAEWRLQCDESEDNNVGSEDSFASVNEAFVVREAEGDWKDAKISELKSWKENNVYTETRDCGQDRIHCRWICTKKDSPSGKVAKARLVAKGFQDVEANSTRSDSPTCAKESLRMVLMIIASNNWDLNSMDIKTAFLQGMKFERDVFLVPPPEAEVEKGRIWKLNKCVYGLTDASRVWYLTVREKLVKLGMNPSVHDEAIFTYQSDGKLQGVVSTHVDDFCWAGSKCFEKQVIDSIRKIFKVKSEDKHMFKYLGLHLSQEEDKIHVKQDQFVQSVELIKIERKCIPSDVMIEAEVTKCRSALGKLNWLATQTRPDLSYQVSELTSALRSRQVSTIHDINKAIRKAKKESSQLVIPRLSDLSKCKLVTYSDASFANVDGTKSQGGYITFLTDGRGSFPLAWQSQKVKRVVKSTQAAETLALVDAAEASLYYKSFLLELLGVSNKSQFPIHCKTDNASLHGSVHSNTQILDKRLRIETAILREMISRGEIASISWVPTKSQRADALTKSGAPSSKVIN